MDDFAEPIPKSNQVLDPDIFSDLLRICVPRPWLCRKDRVAAATLNECDTVDERAVFLHLLKTFSYFDSEAVNDLLEEYVPHVEKEWSLEAKDTLLTTLSRDDRISSGVLFLSLLRNKLKGAAWTANNFVDNLVSVSKRDLSAINKIVLCDDFAGTGRTVKRKTAWLRKELSGAGIEGVEICYFGLAGMKAATPALVEAVDRFHVCDELRRGISDHFDEPQKTKYIDAMKTLELKLKQGKNFSEYSLGFGQSESVYSLQDSNIPNNVFPIFWWPNAATGSRRAVMFKRIPKG